MKHKVLLILFCIGLAILMPYWHAARSESRRPDNSTSAAIGPQTRAAAAFGTSARVDSFARPATRESRPGTDLVIKEHPGNRPVSSYPKNVRHDADAAMADRSGAPMPTPLLSFDGLSNYDNIDAYGAVIIPPDMIGDVGPNNYVQVVNALVRIFDKQGTALTPPFKMSQLFAPLATACSNRNDGEAIVLYDPLADRWLLSQYCTNFPPFRQMVAVSKTGDPAGAYFLYEFVMPNIRLNDFAKFGVWPDGYYMSTDEFTGSDYSGSGMFAFDRSKMLAGDPSASYIYFHRPSVSAVRLGNLLPSDLDGLRPPAIVAPNIFVGYSATEYGEAADAIRLFNFHADFADPANSNFIERVESPLPVAAFDPRSPEGRSDITQPAPGEKLDANSDRLNYRAAYRNLGQSEAIILNQTVRIGADPYRAGVRVYELKRTGGVFYVVEQSTIGSADSSHWIGSAAQDHQGNLAVGYSVVTDLTPPSIQYTGRAATEPAGVFRDETPLINGTGVQKAFGWRWGDYSGMSVDPVDDCTFWMTGEYYTLASQEFSDFTWLTRIGAFKFPECTPAPQAAITGRVTNASNGQPVVDASVTASVYSRRSDSEGSYAAMRVLPGPYTVTASAHGFLSQSFLVNPADGQSLVQNFALTPVPVIGNTAMQISAESCGPDGAPEPGETVTVAVTLRNTGSLPTHDLRVTLLAGGGVTLPGRAQSYGVMAPGVPAVTRSFAFRVAPDVICGDRLFLTLRLFDNGEDLGNLTIPMQTGTPKIAFMQDFDRGHLAQLPPRWTRVSTGVHQSWTVSTTRSQSGRKSAFSPDPIQAGVNEMETPVFFVKTSNARLSFRNWYDLETTFLRNRLYDGSVLEIRIADGAWQDILTAGGVFESGGYDGLIDACCQNPLAGRPGWSGRSGIDQTPVFITTAVKLPPAAAGQRVQLRWRVGSDIGGFREGQYIDDVQVADGFVCGCVN